MNRTFVDTNVLVYASRPTAPMYPQAISSLYRLEGEGDELCISRQVLREYLATVTRPDASTVLLDLPDAAADTRRLTEIYTVLEDGPRATEHLLRLVCRFPTRGKRVHDTNVVATMLANGVTRLLTFNQSDFVRFGALIELVAP